MKDFIEDNLPFVLFFSILAVWGACGLVGQIIGNPGLLCISGKMILLGFIAVYGIYKFFHGFYMSFKDPLEYFYDMVSAWVSLAAFLYLYYVLL